jgi:hypothetical protein
MFLAVLQKWNSVIPNVNLNYTTEGPILTPFAWLKNGVTIFGQAMMWPSLEASSIAVELDGLNSFNFEFNLGKCSPQRLIRVTWKLVD